MKHIGFDDSLVLREYAKIASEQGFVKEAEQKNEFVKNSEEDSVSFGVPIVHKNVRWKPPMSANKYAQSILPRFGIDVKSRPTMQSKDLIKSLLQKFQVFSKEVATLTLKELNPDDKPAARKYYSDVVDHIGNILVAWYGKYKLPLATVQTSFIFPAKKMLRTASVSNDMVKSAVSPTDNVVAELNGISGVPGVTAKQLAQEIEMYKNDPQAKQKLLKRWKGDWAQYVNKAFPVDTKTSSKHDRMSKEAEGKLYDISGETGEQLVEKAHPGGGTKTELTHSKTDENLVETIVEQQEKDIDVAHSVPKGTYALLINLYNQLHKMGYEKHLGGLASTINKIATDEDMVMYTLSVLADNLDAHGFIDVADRVDEIAKLAGIFDWWVNYDLIGKVIDRLEDIDKSDEPPLSTWLQRLQNLKMQYNNVLGQVGNTPEEQAKIDQSKTQIANVVKTNLEQLQKVYTTMKGQGQIEEWSGDDTEFEAQLQQVIDLLSKEQQKIDVKIDPNWEQSEEVKQWGEEFQQQQEEEGMAGKGKPATKEDSELKKWQANYNMLLKKVKSKGIDISQYSGGKKGSILVDGIPGPETAQAKKDAPKLKALLEGKSTAEKPAGKTFTDAEVMKRMYDSAISQLEDKFGYTGLSEEPTETKRISDIIRQHSSFYNLSDKKGRQNAWNVIKKEIGKLYPARA